MNKKKIVYFLITAIFILPCAQKGTAQSIEEVIQSESSTTPSATAEQNRNTASQFAIQLAAFRTENDAQELIINLKDKGFDPYIFQTINSKSQKIYSVRIGNYSQYNKAAQKAKSLREALNRPLFIASHDSLRPVDKEKLPPSALGEAEPDSGNETDDGASDTDNQSVFAENMGENEDISTTNKQMLESENEASSQALESLQKKMDSLESEVKKLRNEAEVRQHLKSSKAEEESYKEEQEDILEDVDRKYTLREAGEISFNLGLSYSHNTYDAIRESARVEDVANHNINTSFGIDYGFRDNLTIGFNVPFKYKYHHVGTIHSKETTGLGDVKLKWQYQPLKTNYQIPTFIINGDFRMASGTSPYEIQRGEELSTGSGIYSTSIGASISKVVDPVVVFSSFSFEYPFTISDIHQKRNEGILQKVDPGIGLGLGFGFGAAISADLNMNMSVGYSYSFESRYYYKDAPTAKSGVGAGANLSMGCGYKYYENYKINFNIKFPLSSTGSYSISFNTPIRYNISI